MTPATDAAMAENIKNRQDIVLGAGLAVVAGFMVNTFSGIFYDIVIAKTLAFEDISSTTLSVLLILFIIFEAFLEFLIYDVRQGQDAKIDIKFLGRFLDFIEKKHWMNRATKSIIGMAWLGTKIILWLGIFISLLAGEDYVILVIFAIGTGMYQMAKRGAFRKPTKKGKL